MCGIAGLFNLSGGAPVDRGILMRMAEALHHRGPDELGIFTEPGIGLVSRRLSLIDPKHGQQPQSNESGTVQVVFNGEIYDAASHRDWLAARGHRLRTTCDTELLPHYYEELDTGFLERLNGQFSLAIHDAPSHRLLLARDRFGITPLYYTRATRLGPDWLVFASEMKAMFRAGLIAPEADPAGLDQVFNFLAVPGPQTCFKDIHALPPGCFLDLRRDRHRAAAPAPRPFTDYDFPTTEADYIDGDENDLVDRFERLFLDSVARRLVADVPVGTYLSGGVDSSLITAMAARLKGEPPRIFSIQMEGRGLDESAEASSLASALGGELSIVKCNADVILDNYARLIEAGEAPVVDTSAVAMMLLAETVRGAGYKAVLTGEGSDEWLGGYPWFQVAKILETLNACSFGLAGDGALFALRNWIGQDSDARQYEASVQRAAGGQNAFHLFSSVMNANRRKFYSRSMRDAVEDIDHYGAIGAGPETIARWHPMNRAVYWGARIFLQGHLLSLKGDRVAMASSVETRYPFLDEHVVRFMSDLHPKWKIRNGRSKYLLRRVAERWLPQKAAWRQKRMLRGPSAGEWICRPHPVTDRYLSREALERTGYFDVDAVLAARKTAHRKANFLYRRESETLGLVGVLATQIWHERFLGQGAVASPTLGVPSSADRCSRAMETAQRVE